MNPIIGWFLLVVVTSQGWPIKVGSYDTQSICMDVEEFLERRGYETSDCSTLPLPQEDAQLIEIPYLPKEFYLVAKADD